jgi:hypothetical protein
MAIIARRIRSGLDGAESCGPTQQWDPNYVFQGIKGQCTPKGSPMTPAPSPGFFESFMSAMFKPPAAPTAMVPAAVAPASSQGMSQNTMIALGLGAVGLVALVVIATRK